MFFVCLIWTLLPMLIWGFHIDPSKSISLFWFFESPKWKLRIWRPKSISGIKTSQTVNRKKKPKSTLFFKEKKNLINKKWIKNEFSTFLRTKKQKEASFGVNPVHDLYRNNEKYTQPGSFGVKSPSHYSIKRSILQSIAELIQKKEKKEKEMNKIWK